jgi:hypothetical protein
MEGDPRTDGFGRATGTAWKWVITGLGWRHPMEVPLLRRHYDNPGFPSPYQLSGFSIPIGERMHIKPYEIWTCFYEVFQTHALFIRAIEGIAAECFSEVQVTTEVSRLGRDVHFTVISGKETGIAVTDNADGEPVFEDVGGGETTVLASIRMRKRRDRRGAIMHLDLGPSISSGEFLQTVNQRMDDLLDIDDQAEAEEIDLDDEDLGLEIIPPGTPPPAPVEAFWQ